MLLLEGHITTILRGNIFQFYIAANNTMVHCRMLFKTSFMILTVLSLTIYFSIQSSNPRMNFKRIDNRRIYFHETSGKPSLNFRQTCAVESAANENPSRPIQLFMQTNSLDDNQKDPWYFVLTRYSNIQIILINTTEYFANTPLEKWHNDGVWRNGENQFSHFSDYIRMLSLLKGGGLYMDLDFITLQPLDENILWNFFPMEDKEASTLNGGIFHFEAGHRLIDIIIQELAAAQYDPKIWIAYGPTLITEIMKDVCGFKPGDHFSNQCQDVQILPYSYFYPINYFSWETYFKKINHRTASSVKHSYAVHIWNHMSERESIVLRPRKLFTILASNHCPKAFAKLSQFQNV